MKYAQLVFSPTGGTRKAADAMSGVWSGETETVDLSDGKLDFASCHFNKEDLVLIAMPSFGGLAPQPALDRLCQVSAEGTPCVLLCVYGNRAYDNTLAQMEQAAVSCGFRVAAAVGAVAEHSMARKVAAGRPNDADCAELASFAEKIRRKLESGDTSAPAIPGKCPEKQGGGMGIIPKAGSKCVSCGVCAAKCPTGAIDVSDPKKTDKNKCITCMRCVSVCPANARNLNPVIKTVLPLAMKKICSGHKNNELLI